MRLPRCWLETRRQWLGAPVVQGDAFTLPFAAGTFDAAVALRLAFHFADLDALLREAARVVAPVWGYHLRHLLVEPACLAAARPRALGWRGVRPSSGTGRNRRTEGGFAGDATAVLLFVFALCLSPPASAAGAPPGAGRRAPAGAGTGTGVLENGARG